MSIGGNLRKRGIIGFQKGKNPNYRILLTEGNAPLSETGKGYRVKNRNLFAKAAIETLDSKFSPNTIASVGGMAHYFFLFLIWMNEVILTVHDPSTGRSEEHSCI